MHLHAKRSHYPTALELPRRPTKKPHEREAFFVGAGEGSRTPVSTLGRSYNSRYTTPALVGLQDMPR